MVFLLRRMVYSRLECLPTIKKILDELWDEILFILPPEKPNNTIRRPAVSFRKLLYGILYVLRTGCQWKIDVAKRIWLRFYMS